MKIAKVIEMVDALRPNTFDEEQKVRWLAELDGTIGAEVMLMGHAQLQYLNYQYPDDMETMLLVQFPYDKMYEAWLTAKIDYANGEYDKYQNSMQMFNAAYEDFVCWFANRYEPAQGYPGEGYA